MKGFIDTLDSSQMTELDAEMREQIKGTFDRCLVHIPEYSESGYDVAEWSDDKFISQTNGDDLTEEVTHFIILQ